MEDSNSLSIVQARAREIFDQNSKRIEAKVIELLREGKSEPTISTKKQSNEDLPTMLSIGILFFRQHFFYMSLILLLSFILVNSATDFFGKDPEGILKAVALECGILALVAYKTRSFVQAACRMICLTAAIILSVSVLHVGAKQKSTERQSTLTSIENNIKNTEERRAALIAAIRDLPESHITNKRRMLSDVTEADKAILGLSNKKEALLMSNSLLAVSLSEMTDTFVRLVFLMLNMFFTHVLASKLQNVENMLQSKKDSIGILKRTLHRMKRFGLSIMQTAYFISGGVYFRGDGKTHHSQALKT